MSVLKEARKPYSLRIPEDLKKWVKQQAKRNMRSMNAEIITLLTGLKDKREKPKG